MCPNCRDGNHHWCLNLDGGRQYCECKCNKERYDLAKAIEGQQLPTPDDRCRSGGAFYGIFGKSSRDEGFSQAVG